MSHKLIAAFAWACLAFIVFATLSPSSLRPRLTESEPELMVLVERVGAFGLLGLLFSFSYPDRRDFIVGIVLGSAILFELLQVIVPDRDAGVIDAIEKLAGGGLGIFAARWLFPRLRTLTYPRARREIGHPSFGRPQALGREGLELYLGATALILFGVVLIWLQQ